MALPLVGVVVAVGLSLARGGRFGHASANHIHWLPVLITGLLLQTLLDALAARDAVGAVGTVALLLVSEAAVLGFCMRNWYRAGMALIAVGFTMNVLVILANGGMPVAPEAIASLGGDPSTASLAGKHHLMTAATSLPWLADVLPVAPLDLIISVGDIVLIVGMVPFAHDIMTPRDQAARLGRRPWWPVGQTGVGS